MSESLSVWNQAAQAWWPWMVRSTWQGAVVLMIVLGLLALWRRATPIWRYSLLLVVLLKFVLPPLGPAAFGLFSWLGQPDRVASENTAQSKSQTLPQRFTQNARIVQSQLLMLEEYGMRSSPDGSAWRRGAHESPDPIVTSLFPPKAEVRPLASLTPASWAFLAQLSGLFAIAVFIAYQALNLRRRLRQGRRVEIGELHAMANSIAERMRLRRCPDLYLCERISSPYAGGLFRRFIMLPLWAEVASEEDQRVLLAHELAHLRRRDPLANWLQIVAQALLWWNPLVWWLNRRIRAERELCCDDLVLGLGLAMGERYSRVLVDVAGRMTRREALLQAIGMADSFSPLKGRIRRALDAGLRRPIRLSLASLVALTAFAAFVLPGSPLTRSTARGEAPMKSEKKSSTQPEAKPIAAAAAAKIVQGTISGQVLRPDGSPASAATVEAYSWANWNGSSGAAKADAQGKFQLSLAPGTYWFRARLGKLGVLDDSQCSISSEGKQDRVVELRLKDGCILEGKVMDTASGKPVAGARIVTDEGDRTTSAEDGTFKLEGLSRKNHAVIAAQGGMFWPVVYFDTTGRESAEVLLETKPGGTIRGKVTNEKGEPIAGALVSDHRSGSISICGLRRMTTDAKGEYALGGYDPDQPVWSIGVEAGGFSPLSKSDIKFPTGQREVTVDFKLGAAQSVAAAPAAAGGASVEKLRRISGHVTDREGKPVKGALVAYGSSNSYVYYKTATSNEKGEYTIEGAQSREDIVVAQASGLAPVIQKVPAEGDTQLNFKLEPGHWIEGRVVDEEGKPLAGIHVSTMMECREPGACGGPYRYLQPSASTDQDGLFRLESLPAEKVLVDVTGRDRSNLRDVALVVDRKDHTLTLLGPGQISGTVVRADNGQPLPNFKIYLGFPEKREPGDKTTGFSAAYSSAGVSFSSKNGTFTISDLNVGDTLRVIAEAPGLSREALDRTEVKPVAKINYKDVVLKLTTAEGFAGAVTEVDGKTGIGDITVSLLDPAGRGLSWFCWTNPKKDFHPVVAQTDAQGHFKFDSVPVSRGAVLLEKSGYGRMLVRDVDCRQPFVARLAKAATIQGTILDESGKPRTGVKVDADAEGNISFGQATTDANGRFVFTDLPPGNFQVRELKGNKWARIHNATIAAGQTYTVDWDKAGEATLEGAVTLRGKPVAGIEVMLHDAVKPDMAANAETSADGRYHLNIPKAGRYRLSFQKGDWMDPNKIYQRQTIELKVGQNGLDVPLPGASLTGQVIDQATQKPLIGATVRAYLRQPEKDAYGEDSWSAQHTDPWWFPKNEVKTDGNGHFEMRNMAAGEWLVGVNQPQQKPTWIGQTPSQLFNLKQDEEKKDFQFILPPMGSARVTVVDAQTKQPLTDFRATCVNASGFTFHPPMKEMKTAATPEKKWQQAYDAHGGLTFSELPPGQYRVVVESEVYPLASFPFEIKAGQTSEITAALKRGGRVAFRLRENKGEKLSGRYWVGYRIKRPGDNNPVLVDEHGPFWGSFQFLTTTSPYQSFVPLPPGDYELEAIMRHEDREGVISAQNDLWHATQNIRVEPGRDTVIEIPLK